MCSSDLFPSHDRGLEDWIYVEKLCEFANTRFNYSIKREAFNAKYNRKDDVKHAEMIASDYALNECDLLTVVDKMYCCNE